jgi:hypothetical protein
MNVKITTYVYMETKVDIFLQEKYLFLGVFLDSKGNYSLNEVKTNTEIVHA